MFSVQCLYVLGPIRTRKFILTRQILKSTFAAYHSADVIWIHHRILSKLAHVGKHWPVSGKMLLKWGTGKWKMGKKPNSNPSPISNFISNSMLGSHFSFSRSPCSFPNPRCLFWVPPQSRIPRYCKKKTNKQNEHNRNINHAILKADLVRQSVDICKQ